MATDLVNPITAAFVVLYAQRFGAAFMLEATDAMLMMLPPELVFSHCQIKQHGFSTQQLGTFSVYVTWVTRHLERKNMLVTLILKEFSQSTVEVSSNRP